MFLAEAIVTFQQSNDSLLIGDHTLIDGYLLMYPHAGENRMGDYC